MTPPFDPQARAHAEHVHASRNWYDLCLKFVRTMLAVPALNPTAISAWEAEGGRPGLYTHTLLKPPANVPIFWSGKPGSAGHVALSDGRGNVWSTDIRRHGKIDLVPIGEIHDKWNLRYEGWSEVLNGRRIIEKVSLAGPKHAK